MPQNAPRSGDIFEKEPPGDDPDRRKSAFVRGILDALPFLVIVVPFAVLFGVVAVEAGLDMFQVIVMSVTVFAGASQFTALQLMLDQAPVFIVVLSAMAVNLRLVMYSAALTPYLGQASPAWRAAVAYCLVDQTYALSVTRFEDTPEWDLRARLAYYFGVFVPLWPMWMGSSIAGALVGRSLPEWLALDFAMPICFLALVAPMLKTAAHRVAAFTSAVLAVALAFIPYGAGLLIAATAAMMAGAQVELWQERRAREAGGTSDE